MNKKFSTSLLKLIPIFVLLFACVPADQAEYTPTPPQPAGRENEQPTSKSPPTDAEPEWPDNAYFPRFPSAEHIYVIPVKNSIGVEFFPGSFRPDWRINNDTDDMMALTLVGMQGLINRHGSQIFLNWQDFNSYAGYWLDQLEAQADLEVLDLDGLEAVNFLMEEFGRAFTGAVVYDPEVPDTINLATMIAGLEDRVIVAPEQLEMDGFPQFDDVYDLRDLVQEQGWGNDVESQTAIYQWAYDNLWPDLEHRMIGMASPGPDMSGDFEGGLNWPFEMASRDYYVALRLSALYLNPVSGPQKDLLNKFISDSPSPIPILGGYAQSENGMVEAASNAGDWQAALSWPGAPLSTGNLSLLAGIQSEPVTYEPVIRPEKIMATLSDQPVAAIWTTDGDAVFYLMQHGFLEIGGWDEMQGQNFGWTINPTMIDLAPFVWNHYVQVRDTVGLVAGLSGGGYIFPEFMDNAQLETYLDHAENYMTKTGLRVVQATLNDQIWTERLATYFSEGLAGAGHLGSIVGYGGEPGRSRIEYFGNPTPSVWPSYVLRENNVDFIVNDLLARGGGTELIDIGDQYLSPGTLTQNQSDAFGGSVAVIPTSYSSAPNCCLAIAIVTSFQPGSYQITFRMKIPEKTTNEGIAQIYAGDAQGGDWKHIAGVTVSSNDFTAVDTYQDFTFEFELEKSVSKAEIRMDYLGTSTALVVDTVEVKNVDPVMPVFALIRVDWNGDVSQKPGQFGKGFEEGGGVFLTVEEFMASLNPEFMIEFAEPLVGSDHPLLIRAKEQFARGQYYESLISVRLALRDVDQ